MQYDIGVVGLGVMGQNLALNIQSRGFSVAGFDLDAEKAGASERKWSGKTGMTTAPSLAELVEVLSAPRKILMMVPAGKPVDAVLAELKQLLQPGDIVLDGGNSFFEDTDRRGKDLAAIGIRYIGTGVSGGEEGALLGPALMPGGPREAYQAVEPILTSIAAKIDGQPCCGYIGLGGSGHYVKMVHNGIEYGIMQLISEVYDLMKSGLGMNAVEMRDTFAGWNAGELNSYLLEITAAVLGRLDSETGMPIVDVILDKAGQKGTGKWASQNALDLGVAIPTINAALEARILSAFKDERAQAARVLEGPGVAQGSGRELLPAVQGAYRLAVLCCYAQGFALMREASREYAYSLDLKEIARIWKGGCIIRAKVLDAIRAAFTEKPDLPNLLIAEPFRTETNRLQQQLRTTVTKAVEWGVPVLGLSSALGYIDSYRRERLPANLLQAQRDYFGAHKYERIDKPRGQQFHTEWLN